MAKPLYGFIGLGNMGQPMARHIHEKGHALMVFDIAGTASRAPTGASVASSNLEIAGQASVIALSLPTVQANRAVVEEIAKVGNKGQIVVDTCTIGPDAAAANAALLNAAGIGYVDSPVSGLKFRAEEGALASMTSGSDAHVALARPLIESYSRVLYHVGEQPGQGQRMKVLNNALYIASLVTTSEVLAYGEHGGLSIDTMLEVLNASSGANFATQQILPKYLAKGLLDNSGADAHIIEKDLGLFIDSARGEGTPHAATSKAFEFIRAFAQSDPSQDMMRIYPFIKENTGRD